MAKSHGNELAWQELSMVQRLLLATDGTVSHILEAYAAEPMVLVKLSQSMLVSPAERFPYGLRQNERAVKRCVVLKGARSELTFLFSESVVLIDRLPIEVAADVLHTDIPVGRLLADHRIETFQETTAYGQVTDTEVATYFDLDSTETLVWRTYEVVTSGRPVAWVTQKFPKESFPESPVMV